MAGDKGLKALQGAVEAISGGLPGAIPSGTKRQVALRQLRDIGKALKKRDILAGQLRQQGVTGRRGGEILQKAGISRELLAQTSWVGPERGRRRPIFRIGGGSAPFVFPK